PQSRTCSGCHQAAPGPVFFRVIFRPNRLRLAYHVGLMSLLAKAFRTKSLDQIMRDSEAPDQSLKRTLGPIQLTALGIGAVIGAGIFATVGTAAAGNLDRPGAGPAIIISFIV